MADMDHKAAIDRVEEYVNFDRHNRDDAADDLRHLAGFGQWDDQVRAAREQTGRPCITVNKLGQFVNQISGDVRQSQPVIDPYVNHMPDVPEGEKAQISEAWASIMLGIISDIEYQSNATSAYTWALHCAAACGIGHWQVCSEYADENTFDQDIRIKRILDPLSMIWDSSSSELDRSDATEGFLTEVIPLAKFKSEYKTDAKAEDFPIPQTTNSYSWFMTSGNIETVRIASHWWKVPVKRVIGLQHDGKVIDLTDKPEGSYKNQGLLKTRTVESHKIMHAKVSGAGYLEDAKEVACKFIPIIPVIGNELSVDGKLLRFGIIRSAKDPQRLYNLARSSAAEILAAQPKSPWLVPLHSVTGVEDFWKQANSAQLPYLPYVMDPRFPSAEPRREPPPQGSQAMYQEMQIADNDMFSTTGIYPSSLGQKSNEASGKAIDARDAQTDTGTYLYKDNFGTSMKRNGDVLISFIERTYDATRKVTFTGPDGNEMTTTLNQMRRDPLNGDSIVNDVSSVKFGVRVKAGSAHARSKEAEKEALTNILTANPQMMQVMGDLWIESLDIPNGKKISARIKSTMPQQLVGQGGMPAPQQDPAQAQVQAMQVDALHLDNLKKANEVEGGKIKNMAAAHDLGIQHATAGHPEPTGGNQAPA